MIVFAYLFKGPKSGHSPVRRRIIRGRQKLPASSTWAAATVVIGLSLPSRVHAADWYTGAEPATAQKDWIIALDAAATVTSNSSAFGALTTTIAPIGGLSQSGLRFRLQEVVGTYSYPEENASASIVQGTQEEGSVLTGYEWDWDRGAIAGYLGFNVRRNELSIPDPSNPVVGSGVGAKVAVDVYVNPTTNTYVQSNASYSTLFHAYYDRTRAGIAIADGIFVGPEATLLGDDFFNQWRGGAHLTGIGFGPMKFSFGAGYAYDRQQKSGYYTSVEGRIQF